MCRSSHVILSLLLRMNFSSLIDNAGRGGGIWTGESYHGHLAGCHHDFGEVLI